MSLLKKTLGSVFVFAALSYTACTPPAEAPLEGPASLTLKSIMEGPSSLYVTLEATKGLEMVLTVSTSPDFSDEVKTQKVTAAGGVQEVVITGLEDETSYYLQARGEGEDEDTLVTAKTRDSYRPFSEVSLLDLIPRANLIKARITAPYAVELELQVSTEKSFGTSVKTLSVTGRGREEKDFLVEGLNNDQDYYFRMRETGKPSGLWITYATPLTPAPEGKQYIQRLSELAKIGVDEENYPDTWDYVLKSSLHFQDADNDGVLDDPFDSDEDSSNGNWTPIVVLKGTFDGGGFSIDGMRIIDIKNQYIGLFGYVQTPKTAIKDLGVINIHIDAAVSEGSIGGLAGALYAGGTLENNYTSGSIISRNATNVGGLTGYAGGAFSIYNSYSTCSITGSSFAHAKVGGLVGYLDTASAIHNSYAAAGIEESADQENILNGGLVGVSHGIITNSYAAGNINNPHVDLSDFYGGLVGLSRIEGSLIENSFAWGDVTTRGSTPEDPANQGKTGGLAGGVREGGILTNSYRYEGQSIVTEDSQGTARTPSNWGDTVTLAQLQTAGWYTDSSGLNGNSGGDWNIDALVGDSSAADRYFPHIYKRGVSPQVEVPGQPKIPIAAP